MQENAHAVYVYLCVHVFADEFLLCSVLLII